MNTAVESNSPLVSVIIAAYNCGPYLGLAIESALQQTHANLEVVIVNDASTDNTLAVAQSYVQTGKVRVINNTQNAGPGHSRNSAIQSALGQWVVQLDGDDWMMATRVEKLLALASQTKADIVADDLLIVDDATMRPVSTRLRDRALNWKSPRKLTAVDLIRNDLGSVKPLMRKDFLTRHGLRYPLHIRYGEDFFFLLAALLKGAEFWVVPEAMYCLRRGDTGSLTTQKLPLLYQNIAAAREILATREVQENRVLANAMHLRLSDLLRLANLQEIKSKAKQEGIIKMSLALMFNPTLASQQFRTIRSALWRKLRRLTSAVCFSYNPPPPLLGPHAFNRLLKNSPPPPPAGRLNEKIPPPTT